MRKHEALKKFMKTEAKDWAIDHRVALIEKAFNAGYLFAFNGKI